MVGGDLGEVELADLAHPEGLGDRERRLDEVALRRQQLYLHPVLCQASQPQHQL